MQRDRERERESDRETGGLVASQGDFCVSDPSILSFVFHVCLWIFWPLWLVQASQEADIGAGFRGWRVRCLLDRAAFQFCFLLVFWGPVDE